MKRVPIIIALSLLPLLAACGTSSIEAVLGSEGCTASSQCDLYSAEAGEATIRNSTGGVRFASYNNTAFDDTMVSYDCTGGCDAWLDKDGKFNLRSADGKNTTVIE